MPEIDFKVLKELKKELRDPGFSNFKDKTEKYIICFHDCFKNENQIISYSLNTIFYQTSFIFSIVHGFAILKLLKILKFLR